VVDGGVPDRCAGDGKGGAEAGSFNNVAAFAGPERTIGDRRHNRVTGAVRV
jgi:hypothetical protein